MLGSSLFRSSYNGPGFLTLSLFCLLFIFRYGGSSKALGQKANNESLRVLKGFNQSFGGAKEIRSFLKTKWANDEIVNSARNFSQYYSRALLLSIVPKHLLEVCCALIFIIFVFFHSFLGRDISGLLPVISVFGFAAVRVMPLLNSMTSGLFQ